MMACLIYAGMLRASIQSRISCHSVLRNFLVTILSFGPSVIQMLCGLSYFSSLCLLILHSIFISAILILIFKSTFFSSECFSFGCVLFLFQSCMTLRKIMTFLKFSFIFLPCLCLSWVPSLRVFVGVCVSHLEAFLKHLVTVTVFSYLK